MSVLGDSGPLTPEQMQAWRDFLRAYDSAMRTLDEQLRAAHDLTLAEYDVLVQLAMAPDRRLRMGDLARATLFSPSGVTRVCQRLESFALVKRERSADDARGMDAVLTRAGRDRLAAASVQHLEGVARVFARHFDASELASFSAVMRRVAPPP